MRFYFIILPNLFASPFYSKSQLQPQTILLSNIFISPISFSHISFNDPKRRFGAAADDDDDTMLFNNISLSSHAKEMHVMYYIMSPIIW